MGVQWGLETNLMEADTQSGRALSDDYMVINRESEVQKVAAC